MAKNEYAIRLRIKKQMELRRIRLFIVQWCLDAAIIAANETFKRKGPVMAEFAQNMIDTVNEIAYLTVDDAKNDKTLEYTKAKVDEKLKYILGDDFQDWETRYDFGENKPVDENRAD